MLPLYRAILSPSDFGVMEIIERISNIMNICLMTGGIGQAAMAFYLQAKESADRERVAVSVSMILLICFVLAGFAGDRNRANSWRAGLKLRTPNCSSLAY